MLGGLRGSQSWNESTELWIKDELDILVPLRRSYRDFGEVTRQACLTSQRQPGSRLSLSSSSCSVLRLTQFSFASGRMTAYTQFLFTMVAH